MRCVLLVTVLSLSLGFAPGVAAAGIPEKSSAQTPLTPLTPLTPKEKLRRNGLVREGEKLVQAGKWREASATFQEALAMLPDPEALLWAGLTEDKLGNLLSAKALYTRARTDAAAARLPDWVGRADQALAELHKRIPRILVSLPAGVTGTLVIDEVEVVLRADGVEVNPGKHALSVGVPGRFTYQTELLVEEAQSYTVQPPAREAAPPPPPPVEVVDAPKPEVSLTGPIALMIVGAAVGGTGGGLLGTSSKPAVQAVGGVSLGLGAMSVIGGTVWLIQRLGSEAPPPPRKTPPSSDVAFGVAPLPGGGWATVSGRF
jgi:hypothetical protein